MSTKEDFAHRSPNSPLVVRPSGGANCSSVGSVVDMLFVAGTLSSALLVAVTATLDDLEAESPPTPTPQEDPSGDESKS